MKVSYVGYSQFEITEIVPKSQHFDIELQESEISCTVGIVIYEPPVIDVKSGSSGSTYKQEDIHKSPYR